MAKHGLLGGLVKFTVAAAAVSGICYLFRDDIKTSKTYQKYEVDEKISKAKNVVKDKTATIKDKAKDTTATIKEKAAAIKEKAPWSKATDEDIADDEIILDGETADRDYVSLDSEKVAEAAEEVKEAAADAAAEIKDAETVFNN